MNPEIKAKWLAALRSGAYTQGIGQLVRYTNRESKYCCLGVLCDVLTKEGIPGLMYSDNQSNGSNMPGWEYQDGRETAVLPVLLATAIGLYNPNPVIPFVQSIWDDERMADCRSTSSSATPLDLATLNDHGFTFLEIADLIEAYL